MNQDSAKVPAGVAFSASSLQDYVDCARRFRLRYMDAMAWPAAEAEPQLEVEAQRRDGIHFHRLAHMRAVGLPVERIGRTAMPDSVRRWWMNYVRAGPVFEGYTKLPEILLRAPVGEHELIARYDLIALRQGAAEIYEWKTARRPPQGEALARRWQTRAYMALLARAGNKLNAGQPFEARNISMTYWFAEFPDSPVRIEYDEAKSSRDWNDIESLVAEISQSIQWPPTDEHKRCRYCVYRSYCLRGGRAGEAIGPVVDLSDSHSAEDDLLENAGAEA